MAEREPLNLGRALHLAFLTIVLAPVMAGLIVLPVSASLGGHAIMATTAAWYSALVALLVLLPPALHVSCPELPGPGLLVSFVAFSIGAVVVAPSFIRSGCGSQVTACKSNLKNIGTALEMYSTDNSGAYPSTLTGLTPDYLKSIPTCPTAGEKTYIPSYRFAPPDTARRGEAAYTVFCSHRHKGIAGEGYPQYNSTQGLIEK